MFSYNVSFFYATEPFNYVGILSKKDWFSGGLRIRRWPLTISVMAFRNGLSVRVLEAVYILNFRGATVLLNCWPVIA